MKKLLRTVCSFVVTAVAIVSFIAADGGQPHDLGLAMDGVRAHSLSVHPDGRHIAFTAGTPRRPEVWVLENFRPAEKTGKNRRGK